MVAHIALQDRKNNFTHSLFHSFMTSCARVVAGVDCAAVRIHRGTVSVAMLDWALASVAADSVACSLLSPHFVFLGGRAGATLGER